MRGHCCPMLVACLCLLVDARVHAEAAHAESTPAAPPAKSASQRAEMLRSAQTLIDQGDAVSVERAFGSLAALGGDAAAQIVVARLRRGLPPQLIENAIATLVQIKSALAASALQELTLHRRATIRAKAIDALGALKARSAQSALLYALDDPSADVRSSAVRALANAGTARALPALLTAAERGVVGAWPAAGSLTTTPADLKLLLSHAPAGDITALRPALDAMIARSNLPLESKLRTVQELEKLGTPSARACLATWLLASKDGAAPRFRDGLAASIKRLDGGSRAPDSTRRLAVAAHGGGKSGELAAAPASNHEATP
jgi:hypothetical protein